MIILASSSPRRRELLSEITKNFIVVSSDCDESVTEKLSPEEYVKTLALRKARSVANTHNGDTVIGADTVVALDGVIYGKPKDKVDAARILSELSGKTHCVFTGVAVIKNGKERVFADCSEVEFYSLDSSVISAYIDSGIPMDKAGAYAVQNGENIVELYRGSYSNIVGLPLEKLREILLFMEVN